MPCSTGGPVPRLVRLPGGGPTRSSRRSRPPGPCRPPRRGSRPRRRSTSSLPSSLLTPSRLPSSMSACAIQRRNPDSAIPRFFAIWAIGSSRSRASSTATAKVRRPGCRHVDSSRTTPDWTRRLKISVRDSGITSVRPREAPEAAGNALPPPGGRGSDVWRRRQGAVLTSACGGRPGVPRWRRDDLARTQGLGPPAGRAGHMGAQ